MADTDVITAARARQHDAGARRSRKRGKLPTGTYFADWVAPAAQKAFDAEFGQVRVTTTLDADLQRIAVRAINRAKLGEAQAALVAMRPDGEVVAMVGGKSYGTSPFNRATQARRQPGSAFKLFVYLAALARRLDSRQHHRGPADHHRRLDPGEQRRGLSAATSRCARPSRGRAMRRRSACRRASAAGNVLRAARDLGITTPLPDSPSLALGSAGVNLLQLTGAYAAVAVGPLPGARRAGFRRRKSRKSPVSRPSSPAAAASTRAATARRCSTCCGRRPTRAPASAPR